MESTNILYNVGLLFATLLTVGMVGFHYFAGLNWVESFQCTAFYISGLGSNVDLPTDTGKIWSGIFAIISTTTLVGISVNIVSHIIENKYLHGPTSH